MMRTLGAALALITAALAVGLGVPTSATTLGRYSCPGGWADYGGFCSLGPMSGNDMPASQQYCSATLGAQLCTVGQYCA